MNNKIESITHNVKVVRALTVLASFWLIIHGMSGFLNTISDQNFFKNISDLQSLGNFFNNYIQIISTTLFAIGLGLYLLFQILENISGKIQRVILWVISVCGFINIINIILNYIFRIIAKPAYQITPSETGGISTVSQSINLTPSPNSRILDITQNNNIMTSNITAILSYLRGIISLVLIGCIVLYCISLLFNFMKNKKKFKIIILSTIVLYIIFIIINYINMSVSGVFYYSISISNFISYFIAFLYLLWDNEQFKEKIKMITGRQAAFFAACIVIFSAAYFSFYSQIYSLLLVTSPFVFCLTNVFFDLFIGDKNKDENGRILYDKNKKFAILIVSAVFNIALSGFVIAFFTGNIYYVVIMYISFILTYLIAVIAMKPGWIRGIIFLVIAAFLLGPASMILSGFVKALNL